MKNTFFFLLSVIITLILMFGILSRCSLKEEMAPINSFNPGTPSGVPGLLLCIDARRFKVI